MTKWTKAVDRGYINSGELLWIGVKVEGVPYDIMCMCEVMGRTDGGNISIVLAASDNSIFSVKPEKLMVKNES